MHKHEFPLHRPEQLRDVLARIPMERLENVEMKRDRGSLPEWSVTLHHPALTHSEMHRILVRLDEGGELVAYLESYHKP
jgi:hypothetical protein